VSRLLARTAAVLVAALVTLLALAAAAAAHVSVSSSDAAPGGFGKLTFRVPNESDTASTVALRIQIPEEAALASLSVQPVPGWEVTTTTEEPAEPLEAHGSTITEYVSVVEFRAEEGGGIAAGEFQEFALSGGPFPELDSVSFPTVQTYSDGTESAWIEPTVDGAEPEFPAPTLTLTATETAGDDAGAAAPAADTADTGDGGGGTATTALVVAVVALLAGLAGLVLGLTARRRTVSS
jgi:periplasmic copper chaperone A